MAETEFDRLHPDIRRWIHQKGWTELREVQAQAIGALLGGDRDVVISAATAAGKTEAVFLPILTEIADDCANGFRAMYVGPLKALINDQFFRLEELCDALKVPVAKWHGDVATSMRQRARERPAGILLITPESLEALFVRRPENIVKMFSRLAFVVIDELHSFLASERGVQLASLLKRLDAKLGRSPRRIGLSATLGDLALAQRWLRPADPDSVTIIHALGPEAELKLQVRGVRMPPKRPAAPGNKKGPKSTETPEEVALKQIAGHLYEVMRAKGNHLVFAARRRDVETLSDRLRTQCEEAGVPNEFFPHHGSLSRELREQLEVRLKAGNLPTTAVATATLELGVDIGAVESVGQIGAPRSISALRQRLGRSGRRPGKPAILRMYTIEPELDERSSLMERLRLETVLAAATVDLLLKRWIEPPSALTQHLSTLLHQVLAVIVQNGGISPKAAFDLLMGPGPFASVDAATFKALLRGMSATEPPLIEQASDGTLMLGKLGEQISDSYEFFAVFKTVEEFKIVCEGRQLGTISIENAFGPGDYVIFAGRRWKVLKVEDRARVIQVEAAPAGRVPRFEGGEAGALHDNVVARMRDVFLETRFPVYFDKVALTHLDEGRKAFREIGLAERQVVADDDQLYLFPWRGTATLDALRLALRREDVMVTGSMIAISVPARQQDELKAALASLAGTPDLDGAELAQFDENLERAKYDRFIPRPLLRKACAIDRLNASAVPETSRALLQAMN